MIIELRRRTEETALTYFQRTRDPEIQKFLPQRATTEEEALADYKKTQQPDTASYGRTIYADGKYIGDVWCYGIQSEEPNAMISYCIFDKTCRGKGIMKQSLKLFLCEISQKYHFRSAGAFTFADNISSIRVLEANGFTEVERFTEDGVLSVYFQLCFKTDEQK